MSMFGNYLRRSLDSKVRRAGDLSLFFFSVFFSAEIEFLSFLIYFFVRSSSKFSIFFWLDSYCLLTLLLLLVMSFSLILLVTLALTFYCLNFDAIFFDDRTKLPWFLLALSLFLTIELCLLELSTVFLRGLTELLFGLKPFLITCCWLALRFTASA